MGMYSYISLRVWVHAEKRPANKDETQKIIQALYDDQEINPNQEAQYAFDLEGDWKNEVKWYNFGQDMILFSQKHPEYSFIVQERGTGEFEDEHNFNSYFQGKCYEYDQYFYLIDFVDFDSSTEDLFEPNFTLFQNIEDLKSKVVISEKDQDINIYIPTITDQQSNRVFRILCYQTLEKFEQLGFDIFDRATKYPYPCPFKPIVAIKYYKPNLEAHQTTQDFIDAFFKVAEQYLIGELR